MMPFFFFLWTILSPGEPVSARSPLLTPEDLNRPVSWPAPQTVPVTRQDAHRVAFRGYRDEDAVRSTLPQLYGLSRGAPLDLRPYFEVKVANTYADLDEDAAAFQLLEKFFERKGNRPYQGGIDGFPETFEGLRRRAGLLLARVLARNGIKEASEAVLGGLTPVTGYEALLIAEIYMLLGDGDAVKHHLVQASGKSDGHPDSRWGHAFIPMRGIQIARAAGRDSLAAAWGAGFIRKGRDAEIRPQWRASWDIAARTLDPGGPVPKILIDGTYEGSCPGFDGDIRVRLEIEGGRISALRVTAQAESRPYGALTVIPRRILKHQSLAVDAVTGATVTSSAVIAAAEDALIRAGGGKRP